MSYILDALRKSERERQLSQVPTLKSEHTLEIDAPKSRLPWIITVLVVSNIGLLSLYFLSQNASTDSQQLSSDMKEISSQAPKSVSKPTLAKKSSSPKTVIARSQGIQKNKSKRPPSKLNPKPSKRVRSPSNNTIASKPVQKMTTMSPSSSILNQSSSNKPDAIDLSSLNKEVMKSVQQSQPVIPKNATEESSRIIKNVESVKAPKSRIKKVRSSRLSKSNKALSPQIERIPTLRMMSQEFQQRLPEMKVNVYAYSVDPKERFVIVNMDKYRAGQRIADGPVLQEITADSMILKFSGKKFRLKRP